MALLVLFSTVSFTVEKHFCGDFLVDISYFGDTNGCADELGEKDCDTPETIEKDNCCKDEIEKIEGQDNLQQKSDNELSFEKEQFLFAFIASYKHAFTNLSKQVVANQYYAPPKLTNNVQIIHQVFII